MIQVSYQQQLLREIEQSCQLALSEDLGGAGIDLNRDVSAGLISTNTIAEARLISRESGIFCGRAWLQKVFELLGGDVQVEWQLDDADPIEAGQVLCLLRGNARQLLTGERSAMNFLQTLSGTATATAQLAELIAHTSCQLLDTRKTLPGMRFAQKYAVACGGGRNHRLGLWDAYLIKENHIMACGGIEAALTTARQQAVDLLLEIEVESLAELRQALTCGCDVIMLDNFSPADLHKAVALKNELNPHIKLEASGNVNRDTIKTIAETGVDFVSVGAITKNVRALDLSMRIDLIQP